MAKLKFFRNIRKSILVLIPLALVGAYSLHEAMARRAGVLGQSRIGCSGPTSPSTPQCHGGQSSATVVKFWSDSSSFVIGHSYLFTFSVANASERGGGLDITADNGDSILADPSDGDMQTFGPEATHFFPLLYPSGDSSTWTFFYKPMKAGIRHLYGAGNAVNMNTLEDDGDHWDTTTYSMNVEASDVASVAQRAQVPTLYPNPSRGHVTLLSSEPPGPASIELLDPAGRTVFAESVVIGSSTPLDFTSVSNGTYFLSVKPESGKSFSTQFTIQK